MREHILGSMSKRDLSRQLKPTARLKWILTILLFSFLGSSLSARTMPGEMQNESTASAKVSLKQTSDLKSDLRAQHFLEIEIALGETISLKEASLLPKAPGGELRILPGKGKVATQVSPKTALLLEQRGIQFLVLRRFVAFTDQSSKGHQNIPPQNKNKGLDTGSILGSNPRDVSIPEGSWAYSAIEVKDAPPNARVTSVDVHVEIDHSCVGDVQLDLTNHDASIEYHIKDASFAGYCRKRYEDTMWNIKDFAGEDVNQEWRLWATDWYYMDKGEIDLWWIKVYYEMPSGPAHDEPDNAIAIDDGVPYVGTTIGATTSLTSACDRDDPRDVWHSFTAITSGILVLSTEGSELDTNVSVHDPASMDELACNDDFTFDIYSPEHDTWSQIMMPILVGQTVVIRVAGFDDAENAYQITAHVNAEEQPVEPDLPYPEQGETEVASDVVLQWGDISVRPVLPSQKTGANPKGFGLPIRKSIYGEDGRTEDYEISDPNLLALGEATVLISSLDHVEMDAESQTIQLIHTRTMAEWYEDSTPNGHSLCSMEPFRDQPVGGYCTGFLVAPDIVATAGHCVSCATDFNDSVFLFGFIMEDASTARKTFDVDEMYFGQEIVGFLDGVPDWALVRLDRPVLHIEPLRVRRQDRVADEQSVLLVGHPLGLPRKYDAGGRVRENDHLSYFTANVDGYGGNSGSPVFNLSTLEVEGILVAGYEDFQEGILCDRSKTYFDDGPEWEQVTRATTFSTLIPCFDVHLGVVPNDLIPVAKNIVVPHFSPGNLKGNTTYFWRVTAKNASGTADGPIWYFVTGPDKE